MKYFLLSVQITVSFIGDLNQTNTTNIEIMCNVSLIITVATRNNAILDQIFVDDIFKDNLTFSISTPFGNSDHKTITVYSTKVTQYKERRLLTVYDFRESNIDRFMKTLNEYNFNNLYQCEDINTKVKIFNEANMFYN